MAYPRPKIHAGDKFRAISRKHKHPHRCNPFTAIADMTAYIRAEDEAGDTFELFFCDWKFEKIENDKSD